ncbi:hypothetical protein Dimus_018216, partial [Dionaea muscipula]
HDHKAEGHQWRRSPPKPQRTALGEAVTVAALVTCDTIAREVFILPLLRTWSPAMIVVGCRPHGY